ncbi:MAG TPA: chromosomal replication initiator protein DnaA [Candidatus Binataceae bacterium]|nr:chromosomal replication initiator protein DnaA [Candidatus Binataceae bacterium]
MNGLWRKANDRLREELGQVGFETWIGPLSFVGIQGRTVTIEAPNRFFRDWVNERYLPMLRKSLSDEAGEAVEVKLTLGESPVPSEPPRGNGNGTNGKVHHAERPATGRESARAERHPQLNPRYTFAEFVIGSGNQFAHAAAQAVADQPGDKYNPLFIYGGVGLGKTHLVTAIGHNIYGAHNRSRKVLFMSSEVFMNELIGSIRRDRMNEFREKFRLVDALILDDIQFLAGRERTQEEFFHTFNSLRDDHHQIVLTSDKLPREIPGLEERLRNRFESGLIADISPPDLETRIAIVQKKAALDSLRLTEDVTLYIAQSIQSNVRELEGCLTRLGALASLNKSAITLEFARQALHDLIRNHDAKPDVEMIQKTVAEFFHIRLVDLKSKKRTQHIAFCRQVAMYLCRKLTSSSFPVIGDAFGRDHSTVIHAFNLIQRRVTNDSAFRLSIEKIERDLKAIRANAA